jgi:hypothetical protein
MIAIRRVQAHAALFTALLGVCLLLAGLGAALVGYLDGQSRRAVAAGLDELSGSQLQLRFDSPKTDDAKAQDAAALRIIHDRLEQLGGANLPVRVTTTESAHGEDWVWVVSPIVDRVQPSDLPAFAAAGAVIHHELLADDSVGSQGVDQTGTLDTHAAELQRAIAPMAAAQPVPLLMLAAIGIVTIAELARLLDGVRTRETALVRSRGASARRIGVVAAVEAGIVAVVGAVVGVLAAQGVLALLAAGAVPLPVGAGIAGAVVVLSIVLVAGTALRSARQAFRRDTADDSGRARRFASPALVLLLLAAGVLSVWRLLALGSPVTATASGAQVDPIAVLAPALCLASVVLLGRAVFPWFAVRADRRSARSTGIRPALTARQLARRSQMYSSALVLLALGVGGLVLAAVYQPSWEAASSRTALLHDGADLVADGTSDAASVASAKGVHAASLAHTSTGHLDDDTSFDVTAVPSSSIATVVSAANGAVDPSRLAAELKTPLPGVPIPAGTTSLTATLAWVGDSTGLTAQLVDSGGRVESLDFSGDLASSPATFTTTVPEPAAGATWTMVAVDLHLGPSAVDPVFGIGDSTTTVEGMSTVDASGTHPIDLGPAWTMVQPPSGGVVPDGELGVSGYAYSDTPVRFHPKGVLTVPVVLSKAFATHISARVGDAIQLEAGVVPGALAAKVADIVQEVPGSSGERALMLDLPALQAQTLRLGAAANTPDRVWASSDDPVGAAASIRSAVPDARVSGYAIDSTATALHAVPRALWLGMIGGIILALAALAAVAGELLRLRRDEVVVLRSLGMSARDVARVRRRELILVCVAALVVGAIAGAVTAALTVPGLARAAILDPFVDSPVPLQVDALSLGAALIAALVVVAVILGIYGAQVRSEARSRTALEVAR